ncbi:ATP-binding protein [Neptunomonas japonica]|uniref:histidine kinase n=1 Tax=Neptunomonas japonica JAMM 1380 TaxID=1441457 RepID=A0A7R6PG17_9GAMM|nr:ATP-binding protein [Neptunomonas japonica]BBB28506.1 two-component system, sensor histidine kinase RegB [Neptunomonas japonica JAMM 1380]
MAGNHQQLLQLTYIRFVILFCQCCAVAFALLYLRVDLNPWATGLALLLLGLLNLITYARLHSSWPVTQPEFFTQLLADAIIYGFILYQSGGGTNPFIFMLLIPLIITVMTLNNRYIWMMAITVTAIYGSLLVYYVPVVTALSEHQHSLTSLFNFHMLGMWLNFILTVIVITYFIVRINRALQRQQQSLIEEREAKVHHQQVLALGTMAAGTAHELGTPLSTMSVILHEMRTDSTLSDEHREDIDTLQQQVQTCADKLQHMARSVAEEKDSEKTSLATELLDEIIEQWNITRPDVTYSVSIQEDLPPDLRNTTALRQAILNLLNNAADACPKNIEISLRWEPTAIWLTIRDYGAGLSVEQTNTLGQPFISTKGKGLGIGLFLTSTTLAHYDGDVKLYAAQGKGTITEVRLSRRSVHG